MYFPGSDAVLAGASDRVDERLSFEFFIRPLLKSGRAVLYPVCKGRTSETAASRSTTTRFTFRVTRRRSINYAPRVHVPVLVLNGGYDMVCPLDSGVRPTFELLGTSPDRKALRVYDSDHTIPRSEFIREALLWLDKYLGPVSPAAAALQ